MDAHARTLGEVEPASPVELVNVLYLKHLTAAIYFRPYMEKLDQTSILEWWLERVRIPEGSILYVACHIESERIAILNVLGAKLGTVKVHCCGKVTLFGALAEIADLTHAARIALLPLSACLCPSDLLECIYAHHLAKRNKITLVEGLPICSAPSMFDSDIVLTSPEVQSTDIVEDLSVLLQKAKSLAGVDPTRPPGRSCAMPFHACAAYGLDPASLPRIMALDSPKDVEILRRVHARWQSGGEASLMQLWKEELLSEARRHHEYARGLMPAALHRTPGSNRKKILFIAPKSGFSGAEQVLCDVVSHLDPERFEKFALTPGAEGLLMEHLRRAGVEVICSQGTLYENNLANFGQVLSVLQEIQPDLIHQNGPGGLPLVCAAALMGIPSVLHVHFAPEDAFGEPAATADSLIAVSNFVKGRLLQLNVQSDRVQVIHNGIDCEHYFPGVFSREASRQEFGIPLDAKVVLCVARLDRQKRHDLLLNACARVKATVPSLHLILNGEASENTGHYESVRILLANAGLNTSVTWVPFVSDARRLYAAADVVVLCGEHEGFPRCLAEAMAMKVPVVATKSGGIPELVTNEKTGLLVKPGNADSLTRAITSLLTDSALSLRLGTAARATVESRFSIGSQIHAIMNLYDRLIADTERRTSHVTAAVV